MRDLIRKRSRSIYDNFSRLFQIKTTTKLNIFCYIIVKNISGGIRLKEKKKIHPLLRVFAIIAWVILAVVIFKSCTGENEKAASYTVTEERFDEAGIYYVSIETDAASPEEIEPVLDEVMNEKKDDQDGEVTSAFVRVFNGEAETLSANGKIAYSNKGRAQTGLDETNQWNIEMQ